METTDTTGTDIGTRIWLQVLHGLDKDRLLGDEDKRRRELAKKMDRELERNGWRIFVSAQAHTVLTGKAPARRNAEAMLVETVTRWHKQVSELLPDRMADLERIVNHGIDNPAPLPQKED